ncbi:MAG TPA: BTAD domain-containing putative transcriptional regulator [Actinomycetes bacterium]|nr:BTAD domain-containing putative transcriptional regulator [Actinomycetes bacterium]
MFHDFVHFLVNQETTDNPRVLHLFGGPFVTCGRRRLDVPEGSKRLLAFVALHRGRIERRYAAGMLWPTGDDGRAAGNLRSALWRLNGAGIHLLEADKHGLAIRDDVFVDVHVIGAWAARLIGESATHHDLGIMPWGVDAIDLLPGWYDDWALVERERLRQRLLHALEALSRQLARMRRCAEAVEAAMMAVSAEPLRESAQRTLIEAHLAEGNWVEGRRSFEAYRDVLDRELGAKPDPELAAMLFPPVSSSHRPRSATADHFVTAR